jgi:Transposase DDE domain
MVTWSRPLVVGGADLIACPPAGHAGCPGCAVRHLAYRHDSPLLGPTLDLLAELGPLPDDITVHLDSGYDSGKTRETLTDHGLHGEIARKGEKAPIQATHRWHVERTNAWHNGFNRLQRP